MTDVQYVKTAVGGNDCPSFASRKLAYCSKFFSLYDSAQKNDSTSQFQKAKQINFVRCASLKVYQKGERGRQYHTREMRSRLQTHSFISSLIPAAISQNRGRLIPFLISLLNKGEYQGKNLDNSQIHDTHRGWCHITLCDCTFHSTIYACRSA